MRQPDSLKSLPDEFTGNFITSELYLHPELNGVSDRELLGTICNLSRSTRKFTSIPYLASLYGVSDRNLRARIAKLEKMGFLVRDDRNHKTGKSNHISPTGKCYGITGAQGRMETSGPPDGNILPPRMETSGPPDGNIRRYKTNNKTNNKQDIKKNNAQASAQALESMFAEFWAKYPHKKDKKRAHAAFCKVRPDPELWEGIKSGLYNQIIERRLKVERGEWHPEWKNAATWLNGACWEDVVDLREQGPINPAESWNDYAQRNAWLVSAGLKTEQELYADWQDHIGATVVCNQ